MDLNYTPELIPNNLPPADRRYARHELFRAFPWAVWNSSALEGYNFTLSEVETIINGYAPGNHPIDHIDDVRGIAAGWKTALQAIDQGAEADENLARQINHAITQKTSLAPGQFRGESPNIHGDGGNVRTRGVCILHQALKRSNHSGTTLLLTTRCSAVSYASLFLPVCSLFGTETNAQHLCSPQ